MIIVECDSCGKEFGKYPYSIKDGKPNFCSMQCTGKGQRISFGINQEIGRWRILSYGGINKFGQSIYNCECKCGYTSDFLNICKTIFNNQKEII